MIHFSASKEEYACRCGIFSDTVVYRVNYLQYPLIIYVLLLLPRVTVTLEGVIVVIGFIEHLRIVSTGNNNSLNELHAPNIIVTTAHIKSSQSSLDDSW
jgi:hypothetical protein